MIWHYLQTRWERLLFGLVGVALLAFTFRFLFAEQVAATSAVFAMAFFAFFYSNLARFKKFKGLGFEAELWEDKQKEAAHLIERLKSVASIYTRETVMNSVLRGRMGGSDSWAKRWELLNALIGQHSELGQDIDFSDLRKEVESVFLFDMCSPLAASVRQSIQSGKNMLYKDAQQKFGNPVRDVEGFNEFHSRIQALGGVEDDLYERSKTHNVAQETLGSARTFIANMLEQFNTQVVITPGVLERLEAIAGVADHRPIAITPKLLEWADDHNAFALK